MFSWLCKDRKDEEEKGKEIKKKFEEERLIKEMEHKFKLQKMKE